MNTTQVIQKSWTLMWRYRALWLFGFILAMTTTNALWLGFGINQGDLGANNRIIISPDMTWYFAGEGITIDLNAPGGPVIRVKELSPEFWNDLADEFNLRSVWSILIATVAVVLVFSLLSVLLSYTSKVTLIRMVDENEQTGQVASVGRGFRLGWSRVAIRLFLIDLTIGLLVFLVFGALFFVSISPAFFMARGGTVAIVGGSVLILVLLALFGMLVFAAAILLSISMPVMHRACAQDNMGVWASISQGFRLLCKRFDKVALIWLANLGVSLTWLVASIPAVILLSPVMLLTLLAGIVIGALPGLLAVGIASILVDTIAAWIIGAIVGLPIMALVTFSPLIFLSGLVQVYKSNLWTLTYREIRSFEVRAPTIQQEQSLRVDSASLN